MAESSRRTHCAVIPHRESPAGSPVGPRGPHPPQQVAAGLVRQGLERAINVLDRWNDDLYRASKGEGLGIRFGPARIATSQGGDRVGRPRLRARARLGAASPGDLEGHR